MENDKIFELLNKMNSRFDSMEKDIKDVKQDLSSVKEDVSSLKEDVSTVKMDVNKIYAKIDGDIYDKLKNLGDGYTVNYDISTEIRKNVNENSKNLEDLSMAVSEIRDDVNYIANKTIRQDGRLNKLDKEISNRAVT